MAALVLVLDGSSAPGTVLARGLFPLPAPRVGGDAIGGAGEPDARGAPDSLDPWEAFRVRATSATLPSAYGFTAVDARHHEILYAVADRIPEGPGSVVLEVNQKSAEERLPGDLKISVDLDEEGNVGIVRFESLAVGDGVGRFLPIAILTGEGCNAAGTACVALDCPLLAIGYDLTVLGEPERRFAGIRIRTPQDSSGPRFVPMFRCGAAECVKEQVGIE